MIDKIKAWSLTPNEKKFIKNQKRRDSFRDSISIFQCAQDFDYLIILSDLTKSEQNKIHGIHVQTIIWTCLRSH